MKLKDSLTPIGELQAIRIQYGLSYEQIAFELRDQTELTVPSVYRLLRTGRARKTTVDSIEIWLKKVGRRRYPLESLETEDK